MDEITKKIVRLIRDNPGSHLNVLQTLLEEYYEYRDWCKRQNNHLLRQALGDALLLLGTDKKLSANDMKKFCIRIEKAVFPNGIDKNYYHEGEQRFYKKYLQIKGG